jgi:hypothetical protein
VRLRYRWAAMTPSFFQADQQTHRRVIIMGMLFCAGFIAISLSVRSQPEQSRIWSKADSLVRTAGEVSPAH